MDLKFRDFPEYILKYVRMECLNQGCVLDEDVFSNYNLSRGGFNWDKSIMGDYFWNKVLVIDGGTQYEDRLIYFQQNMQYSKYAHLEDNIQHEYNEVKNETSYLVSKCGKKYKITLQVEL